MQGLLNKSYPFDFGLRKRLSISIWTGLGIFIFILFFQPFDIEVSDLNNYLLLLAGFGGISILIQLVIHLSIPLGNLSFRLGQYNLNILFLFELLIWILSSVAFSFYLRYVGKVNLSMFLVFRIVMVSIIPLVANMLIYEIRYLRFKTEISGKYEKLAKQEVLSKENEHHLEFFSTSRSENLKLTLANLILIRSAENYVEIHFIDKGNIQKRLLRTTLKSIEDQLYTYPQIIRCHRTCLVNISHVLKLKRVPTGHSLLIQSFEEEIAVSRQYLLRVKDALEPRL